ncbi:phosphoglycerate kinase [Mycoplasma sp. Mirounga ES2805-ORL]|uniref:phosphoglycerate kinase n=1 Tax=Mycoplasma sp. Mirounga ES2805-ORL TaxID=754514 RepID=UPI00197C3B0D|nr:phosphoglycerate kinase [Mycoplasma sp. Mirounga ES2805-ORL]QSF13717.1 phosphoglycerate kinase [Mycoplasma sp. Mirounga ES2805-ORL]
MKKIVTDINLKDKKVILRADFNVPIENGIIQDNTRITKAIETIKYIVNEGGKLMILSHLGRIKTEEDKSKKTLELVHLELEKLLNKKVYYVRATRGKQVEDTFNNLKSGEILIIENTRWEDLNDKAESKNSPELGKYWASLADVFINDAFGTLHRAHASNRGIAANIKESAIGFLVKKELEALSPLVENIKKPYVSIIGGAKVTDKIKVLENIAPLVDKLIIGGGMAYTFLNAQGKKIGNSLLDSESLEFSKKFYETYRDKIVLPIDFKVSKEFEDSKPIIQENEIEDGYQGLDVGPKSVDLFIKSLEDAKTIVWNGPLGVIEFENYKQGTIAIAHAIGKQKDCYSVIGGGDSASAVNKEKISHLFSHISTGGGATLEFLKGSVLPGLELIQEK